ncbi:MAG TPA: chlorite dismutase family protein [Thermoguttaceae bacterium]|nr:chlorite dismutase family protein [Anaerolineales bacterium]
MPGKSGNYIKLSLLKTNLFLLSGLDYPSGNGWSLFMPGQTPRTLNHFAFFRFRQTYHRLDNHQRKELHRQLLVHLGHAAGHLDIYQIYPTSEAADILVWTAVEASDPQSPHDFFARFSQAVAPFFDLIEPVHTLWGLTKPSQYTKSRSTQEIDPFAKSRKIYLTIYPFTKTSDWYLMSREARQGMMNEHIRIGKEYPEIKQLLLYSFGLQDQEFVVVYETDDLAQFSDLVYVLRDTEARRFTKSDAPLFTALYHKPEETLALWERRADIETV